MVFSEGHLRRLLTSYFHYSHGWRTHLGLAVDCPEPRPAGARWSLFRKSVGSIITTNG
jgi:hypothetical protein